jgi:hypothetical protein
MDVWSPFQRRCKALYTLDEPSQPQYKALQHLNGGMMLRGYYLQLKQYLPSTAMGTE